MQEILNSHNSQYRVQNSLIKKDVVYVGIRKDAHIGR